MSDIRFDMWAQLGLALKRMGMSTRDAHEASAHLENAAHPDGPVRWKQATCHATERPCHGAPGHRAGPWCEGLPA